MPDLSARTNDQLLDRLGELEREVTAEPDGDIEDLLLRLYGLMQEVTLIHVEFVRRTATGWRPL